MAKHLFRVLFLCTMTLVAAAQAPRRSVALTIDDLPAITYERGAKGTAEAEQITRALLEALKRRHVPAIGFVNQQRVEEDQQQSARSAVLELWLKEHQTLGNHTYSHPKFSSMALGDYERNTIDGERTIAPLLAKYHHKLKYFRYPYNDTGGTAEKKAEFERFLSERHYRIAVCTMENADWMFERVYSHAVRMGDAKHAAEVRDAYLRHTDEALEKYMKLSRDVVGREFPQVMLLHANHLNADTIDEVLTIFERHGFRFVSLDKAQSDKAYAIADRYTGSNGWLWQLRWAIATGKKPDGKDWPDPPKWIVSEYGAIPPTGY